MRAQYVPGCMSSYSSLWRDFPLKGAAGSACWSMFPLYHSSLSFPLFLVLQKRHTVKARASQTLMASSTNTFSPPPLPLRLPPTRATNTAGQVKVVRSQWQMVRVNSTGACEAVVTFVKGVNDSSVLKPHLRNTTDQVWPAALLGNWFWTQNPHSRNVLRTTWWKPSVAERMAGAAV